jgi:DNA mismatch endonuclease (patch repair protein)
MKKSLFLHKSTAFILFQTRFGRQHRAVVIRNKYRNPSRTGTSKWIFLMGDSISPERRSWVMSRVAGKNTSPELAVKRAAHALGLRFQLHRKDLPGTPDLVFPKLKIVVFVNGCFWHRHRGCKRARTPKTRVDYWDAKLQRNVDRDRRVRSKLRSLGWKSIVIWECETSNLEGLRETLRSRVIKARNAAKKTDRVVAPSRHKRPLRKTYFVSTSTAN